MKLSNKVTVRNTAKPIMISYAFLSATVVGIVTLIYFNFNGAVSFANDNKASGKIVTGSDFRILQNGTPIMPVMGVATNKEGVFDVQVRMGIELKKEKAKPIAAEVSMLRGEAKVNSLKFDDVTDLKKKDLQPWILSNYKAGDKICIELKNTVLEPGQSAKVFSLASVY